MLYLVFCTVSGLPVVLLESAERPNYFLCVTGNRGLRLEHWQPGEEFRQKATFIHHQGLWLPGRSSFELHSQKGVFLTLSHTHTRVQNYDHSYTFKISSSFIIEGKTVCKYLYIKYKWSYHQAHITYTDCGMDIDIVQCINESRHTYWKCGVLLMHVIYKLILHQKAPIKQQDYNLICSASSNVSNVMMAVFLHFREQFCDPLPLDVRVEISCMCQSMCENMQRPRCHTLPVFTSVRSCAYANTII